MFMCAHCPTRLPLRPSLRVEAEARLDLASLQKPSRSNFCALAQSEPQLQNRGSMDKLLGPRDEKRVSRRVPNFKRVSGTVTKRCKDSRTSRRFTGIGTRSCELVHGQQTMNILQLRRKRPISSAMIYFYIIPLA